MLFTRRRMASVAIAIAVAVGAVSIPSDAAQSRSAIDAVKRVTPDVVHSSKGAVADHPADLADGVTLPTSAGPIVIKIGRGSHPVTESRNGLVAYGHTAPATQTVLQPLGNGMSRVLHVIEGPTAPTAIRMRMEVPDGVTARQVGRSVAFFDASHTFLGSIDPPWARAADGRPVKAWYELRSHALVLYVQHVGSSYPVVADPFWIPAWVLWACGIGFLSNGAGYWVGGGREWWRFVMSGAVGCVFGIIGRRFL